MTVRNLHSLDVLLLGLHDVVSAVSENSFLSRGAQTSLVVHLVGHLHILLVNNIDTRQVGADSWLL